jgi:hypothetical protein
MFASESALRAMGTSLEEVYGKTVGEFGIAGDVHVELEAARLAVVETGVETTGEVSMPTPEGMVRFTYTISPARRDDGSISGAVATLRDDTAQKAVEAVLRQEKRFTDAIVEAAPGIFFTTDHRPYRPVIGLAQAMEFLHDSTDKFDPEVVAACETLCARGELRL